MKFFKRKAQEVPIPFPSQKHECIFKDLPWYMTTEYSGEDNTASYEIIEPYICVRCGKVDNVVLERERYTNITSSQREKIYAEVRKLYKDYLKPQAVVMDMINDIQRVKDRDKLQTVEKFYGIPHSDLKDIPKIEVETE